MEKRYTCEYDLYDTLKATTAKCFLYVSEFHCQTFSDVLYYQWLKGKIFFFLKAGTDLNYRNAW